jgi:hypothetical protein
LEVELVHRRVGVDTVLEVAAMVLIKSASAETNSTLTGPLAPLMTFDARAALIGTRIATARMTARITANILASPTHNTFFTTVLISLTTSLCSDRRIGRVAGATDRSVLGR